MIIRTIYFVLLLLLVGCQDVRKPEKPENLIAKDMMVDILMDVYLSNAARSVNNKVIRQRGIKLDSFIYKKYQIDSVQFLRSHAYYNADLNTYNEFFVEIEKRLDAMLKESDSLQGGPGDRFKRKQDSINKARELISPPEEN